LTRIGHANVADLARNTGLQSDENDPEEDPAGDERLRARQNLYVFLVVAALVIVGWIVVKMMINEAKLEDCIASGRRTCGPAIDISN
jgi:hypothetical protein